jgi:dTMP kinase
MFILFEGPEGAGKTTHVRRFVEDLATKAGIAALSVREPGGTEAGNAIRSILLSPESKLVPLSEFFLFQAARAQLIQTTVQPALDDGGVVVMDRFTLSTMAYQIAGRGLPLAPCLAALELATDGLIPDVTVLLMASVGVGRMRQAAMKKSADRIEAEDLSFHTRVNHGYRDFARLLPSWRVETILTDNLTVDEVYHKAVAAIAQYWQPAAKLL